MRLKNPQKQKNDRTYILKNYLHRRIVRIEENEIEKKYWQRILFVSFLFSLHHKA
jgi:hypothetical protein